VVRFSAEARYFPLLQIIGSGTHPFFCSIGTGPNRSWHEADYSTPLSSEVKNEKIYTSLPIYSPGVHKDITLTFCKNTHTHNNTCTCSFTTFSIYVKYFLPTRENFTLISIFVPRAGEIFN